MTIDLSLATIRSLLADHEHEQHDLARIPRQAAVATVLRGSGDASEVLLIRRAEHEGDPWSGHMAFPGGHVEPGETLQQAAERETLEEIGLDLPRRAELIGHLDQAHAVARGRRLNMVIAPHVYVLEDDPGPFRPNHEVAEVLWAPLAPMISGDAHTMLEVEMSGERRSFPGYDVDGRVVWGLTYRMLGSLFALLHPDWEPFEL